MHLAAYVLIFMTIFSYIFAFLRDRIFAHYFGAGTLLDIYASAFRLPDAAFIIVISMVSVFALIPVFEKKGLESDVALKNFVDTLFYTFSVLLIIISLILFIFSPIILEFLFTSFSEENLKLLINFTRIFLLQGMFIGLSTFFSSIIQLQRKFFIYSLSPIMYNLGIIIGVLVLYPAFGVYGLAFGVVLGGAMHLGILLPFLFTSNIRPKLRPVYGSFGDVFKTILISFPRSFALSSHYFAQLGIFAAIATIAEGAVSIFWFADNLHAVPLSIFAVSYSVASFPILASYFAKGNFDMFREQIEIAMRHVFFLVIPALIAFVVLRKQIVEVVLSTGVFDTNAAQLTAAVLGILVISTVAKASYFIIARAYYAAQRTVIPFIVLTTSAVFQIVFSYIIVHYHSTSDVFTNLSKLVLNIDDYRAVGLIMIATNILVIEIAAALVFLLLAHINFKLSMRKIAMSFIEHTAASSILAVVIFITYSLLDSFAINTFLVFIFGSIAGFVGCICWALTLYFIENKEYLRLMRVVKGFIG